MSKQSSIERVIVHIGTPKTGTTSFQKWCAMNRSPLESQGILYPKTLGQVNHVSAMLYASNIKSGDKFFENKDIFDESSHERFRKNLTKDLIKEINEAKGCHTLLISNEHLYSRLKDNRLIYKAKELFETVSENIHILVHIRPQIDMLVSNASQAVRLGEAISSTWFTRQAVGVGNDLYNFNKSILKWEEVFGNDRVKVVSFKKNPDMAAYISSWLELDNSLLGDPLIENEALSWKAMAIGSCLIRNGLDKKLGDKYREIIESLPKGEKLKVGREIAEEVQKRFRKENNALMNRVSGLLAQDLEPDWKRYKGQKNVSHLDDVLSVSDEISSLVSYIMK